VTKEGGKRKFVARTVMINRSSVDLNNLESSGIATMEESRIFLEVILQGKLSLLSYNDDNSEHFFIEKDNHTEELIMKTFRRKSDGAIIENRQYRQLLIEITKSKPELIPKILNLPFNQKAFTNLLEDFLGKNTIEFKQKKVVVKQGIDLLVGLGQQEAKLYDNYGIGQAYNIGLLYNIGRSSRLGVGLLLNVNTSNKYSVTTYQDPFFQHSDMEIRSTSKISYVCLKPVVRFNLLSRNSFKIYVQGGLNVGWVLKRSYTTIINDYPKIGETYNTTNVYPRVKKAAWGSTIALGVSYKRFSLEGRNDYLNGGIGSIGFYGLSRSVNLFYRLF
jgi:hypothetical protein